jgi:hypothetical protein
MNNLTNEEKEICTLKGDKAGDIISTFIILFALTFALFLWNILAGILGGLIAILVSFITLRQSCDLVLYDNYFIIKPHFIKRQLICEKFEYSKDTQIYVHQAVKGNSFFTFHIPIDNRLKKYSFTHSFTDYYINVFKFFDSKKMVLYFDDQLQAETVFNIPKDKLLEKDKGYWGLFGYNYFRPLK